MKNLYNLEVLKSIHSFLKERYKTEFADVIDVAGELYSVPAWCGNTLSEFIQKAYQNNLEYSLFESNTDKIYIFIYKSIGKIILLKNCQEIKYPPERMYAAIEFILYKILYLNSLEQVNQMNVSITAAKTVKNAADRELLALQQSVQALHRDNDNMETRLNQLNAQIKTAKEKNDNDAAQIVSLSAVITISRDEEKRLKDSVAHLMHEKTAMEAKLQELSVTLVDTREANDELQRKISDLDELITRISAGRRKLMKIYDALDDPIITTKYDYSLESVNDTAAAIVGLDPVDVVKKELKCYQLLGKTSPCDFCFLNLVQEDKHSLSRTIDFDVGGSKHVYILNMIPIMNGDKIDVVIEYFKDVTEMMDMLEEKTMLETKLKDEMDEKERIRVTVNWTQVDRVKQLTSYIGMMKTQLKFQENKIRRLEVIIDNQKQKKAADSARTTMLYEITKIINLLQNLVAGKKIVLSNVQELKLEEAISLIKDYSVFLQGDVTRLEKENEMFRKQIEEYENALKNSITPAQQEKTEGTNG